MADEIFDENLLMEKLSKLNSSRQSIETLSQWCISHRKKAKQVVEIWDRLFKAAQKEQLVSFLYLANDILQNSRRKGSEFVTEYLKVLPLALKVVHETGNENCRKAASRLVDIWEERKVFGSRVQNLKNEMLGENPSAFHSGNPSPDTTTGKNSNPIKAVNRHVKSAVGGLPRKILTTFQLVQEEEVNEETTLNICRNAVSSVQEIVDFINAWSHGDLQGSDIADYIQTQENILQQCISQLENSVEIRDTLISQLKEALQDQEPKLDLLQNGLHVAWSQIKKAENIKLRLTSSPTLRTMNQPVVETGFSTVKNRVEPSFSDEESKKATAAALAAQLTSISSSAQMLTSVLSSLVTEEVASKSAGLKRPKLESPPAPFSSLNNPEVVGSTYFPQLIPSQAPFYPPLGSSYNHGLGNQLLPLTMAYSGPGSSLQQPGQPPQCQQHQQPGSGGHFGPVGTGFYGHNHRPSTPPVQKQ